jgi:hypothetical protein
MWDLCGPDYGLMAYWLPYARKFPERVVSVLDVSPSRSG